VNRFERKVHEVEANLLGKSAQQICAQHLRLLLAIGALEVAEQRQNHRRAGRAVIGLKIRLQLVEIGFEGILFHVVDRAAHDVLAVFRDVEHLILGGGAGRGVDVHFKHSRQRRGLRIGDLHFDLRAPNVKMPHVGFERRLVERGGFRVGRLRQGQRQQAHK
jgi:hypothetical protein